MKNSKQKQIMNFICIKPAKLCFLMALLFVVGCGSGESVIDARLKSDGYTVEKLVREIQVQYASLDSTAGRSKGASSGSSARDDRQSDGPKREPLTFESITKEIKGKIADLQEASGDDVDVLGEVIAELEKSNMNSALKEKVIAALR